jgi:hypothetical protein
LGVLKSRRIGLAERIESTGEMYNAYRILVSKLEDK